MKDRSKIISFTTACAMLVLMACIGLYYMQYDYDAAAYLKAFGYLVMTVSSIVALIFTANEEGMSSLFIYPNTTNKNIKNFSKKFLMFSQKDAEGF